MLEMIWNTRILINSIYKTMNSKWKLKLWKTKIWTLINDNNGKNTFHWIMSFSGCKLSSRGSWKLREHRINMMQQRKRIENISNETVPNHEINIHASFYFFFKWTKLCFWFLKSYCVHLECICVRPIKIGLLLSALK